MRIVVSVCLVMLLSVPALALSLDEMGFRLDFGPDPLATDRVWMTTFGIYGDVAFGHDAVLRLSLRAPLAHWLPHVGFELTYRLEPMLAVDAAMHAATTSGDLLGAEFDLGLRAILADNRMWYVSCATHPLGLQFVSDGPVKGWAALLALNASIDLSLCVADRIVFGENLRIAFLNSRPIGEPLFPANDTFGLITHMTMTFGLRLAAP